MATNPSLAEGTWGTAIKWRDDVGLLGSELLLPLAPPPHLVATHLRGHSHSSATRRPRPPPLAALLDRIVDTSLKRYPQGDGFEDEDEILFQCGDEYRADLCSHQLGDIRRKDSVVAVFIRSRLEEQLRAADQLMKSERQKMERKKKLRSAEAYKSWLIKKGGKRSDKNISVAVEKSELQRIESEKEKRAAKAYDSWVAKKVDKANSKSMKVTAEKNERQKTDRDKKERAAAAYTSWLAKKGERTNGKNMKIATGKE